jgi:hypothetical protein
MRFEILAAPSIGCYAHYGLDEKEIAFIEEKVMAME